MCDKGHYPITHDETPDDTILTVCVVIGKFEGHFHPLLGHMPTISPFYEDA